VLAEHQLCFVILLMPEENLQPEQQEGGIPEHEIEGEKSQEIPSAETPEEKLEISQEEIERRKIIERKRNELQKEEIVDEGEKETIEDIKKEVQRSGPLATLPSEELMVDRMVAILRNSDQEKDLRKTMRVAETISGESFFDAFIGRLTSDEVWQELEERGWV